jgi:hypothetical protein
LIDVPPFATPALWTALLVKMLKQNTQLTETVKALTERVEALTLEVHKRVVNSRSGRVVVGFLATD